MQMMSFSQLQSLAKEKSRIVEADSGFSFSEFASEYKKTILEFVSRGQFTDDAMYSAIKHQFKNGYLFQHRESVKFIGQGSSRMAFAFGGGKCLKVAYSNAGKAQNETEFINAGVQTSRSCFARNFEHDDDWTSMVVECCSRIDTIDARRHLKMLYGHEEIVFLLTEHVLPVVVGECQCNMDEAKKTLGRNLEHATSDIEGAEIYDAIDLLSQMIEEKKTNINPAFKTLNDLVKFYEDNGRNDSCMSIADLANQANWGMAIRDGISVPVVVDAGFSNEVRDNFY